MSRKRRLEKTLRSPLRAAKRRRNRQGRIIARRVRVADDLFEPAFGWRPGGTR